MDGISILAAALPRAPQRSARVTPPNFPRPKVEPIKIHVSDHAYRRAKERIGLKGKAAVRRVEQAWWRGLLEHEAPAELAIWLARKRKSNRNTTSIRVLGDFAFVFAQTTCLTILCVPDEPELAP